VAEQKPKTTSTEHEPLSRPDLARLWLAVFHKLDPGQQRGELLSLLRASRAAVHYSQDFLDSVMQVDQAWHPIATELSRNFRRDPNAITDEPVQFHQEMAEVSRVFAEIYAAFVDEFSKEQPQALPDKQLPGTTALALFHFGKSAKFLYCRNELPTAQFWQRVHSLYSLARSSGFGDERLALFPNEEVIATCSQLWLRTIMLATASTGNLTSRQLDRTEEWLRSWCTRITVDTDYDSSEHVYCVDIADTRGPQRITREQKLAKPLYLGTKHLHQDILAARTRIVEDSMITSIGWYVENPLKEYFELLDRLQQMWMRAASAKSQRASLRIPGTTGERVEVVRGFAGILALTGGATEVKPNIEPFSVIDHSDLGFGLLALVDEQAALGLMELVAVTPSVLKEWKIGVIVRTTLLPTKGRLVGVHLLTRTATLVSLTKAPLGPDSKADRLEIVYADPTSEPPGDRAFFLVGDATKNQADSLLAPIGAYAPGDRLKLKTASQAFLIRVNRVIQRGEDWERTGFQVLEKLLTKLG
jgi:hypothetical protein